MKRTPPLRLFAPVVLGALLLLAVTGCTTRYKRANELAKEGKFVEAAELFEQLVLEDPEDKELPQLLQRARQKAVEHALGRARQFRLAEDPVTSQRHFAEGLELRRRWNIRLNGALEQTVEDEREDATERLRALVLPHTQQGHALTAESLVERHQFLLRFDELEALRTELVSATAASGHATCAKLTPTAGRGEPYWTALVSLYCKHFETKAPAPFPLPDTFSAARVDVALGGAGQGLQASLAQQLEAKLRRGPWYEEQGPQTATLTARGETQLRQRQDPVRLSAEWHEQVPYTEYVREVLEETVPVTECESYQENSPQGPIARVREVTRNKVQKREVVVPKTRVRAVPRTFEYQALRLERTVAFSARSELAVGGQLAAAAGQEASGTDHGYFHDVVFEPAGVRPVRPDFGSPEKWLEANVEALAERFEASMREGWRARFCKHSAYGPEDAARCLRAVEAVPKEAFDALRPRLGEDASHVLRLYTPGTAQQAVPGPKVSVAR